MRMFSRLAGACGALALAATPLLAQTQTLPAGFDTTEGSSSTGFPFSTTATHKWHWAYDNSNFSQTFPILITQVQIRPNGGTSSWGPAQYDNFTMRMGAVQNDYAVGNYDLTFDNNWAPGEPQDFFQAGNLVVPAGVGGSSPNPWSITVTPTGTGAAVLYDPTSGNDFTVELRTPGSGAGNPTLHTTDGQTGTAGTVFGNRYGHTSDPNAVTANFNNNEFVPIVLITYNPATGLFADFTATPTAPGPGQVVQFTDTSFSSDPGGVTTWAWDLDGNGTTDSTVQNPTFSYGCGSYDVTLTVTDASNPTSSITKTGYINVVAPVADFSATPLGGAPPLMVTFTDLSTGNPTSWAWDLDGNGTTDSTAQNPTFTYMAGGLYSVTLTATNACGPGTTTKTDYIGVVVNDECTGAIPVMNGLNGPFSNIGSTTSTTWSCAGTGGSDVWFSYTAMGNNQLEFNTCTNSTYDTALQLFDGTCAGLNFIACNDDSCSLQSRISLVATAGVTYYLAVGGFNGAQGNFDLEVIETAPPANDDCANAIPINFGLNGPFSNQGATTNPLDPAWPCALGGSDVWFTFRPACATTLTAETCSAGTSFDTGIEVFDGSCGALNSLGCNDDSCGLQSSISWAATRGTTYYIRVGGFNGATGTFDLTLSMSGSGTFTALGAGCGGTTQTATGSPNIGGSATYTMAPVTGSPLMWIGLAPLGVPLCAAGCNLDTTVDFPFSSSSIMVTFPCDPLIVGATFFTQGLDFGAPGGCIVGPLQFTTSDSITTVIGS